MKYKPEIGNRNGLPQRKTIRLKGYDYSQPSAYFVTICTQDRKCLFGEIAGEGMLLNDAGGIVHECWQEIPQHFRNVEVDLFIIMPNHVHGIITINSVGANNYSPLQIPIKQPSALPKNMCGTSKTIGSVIRGFKIGVTKWFRQNTGHYTVWQRNYYEHIIRNDAELNRIRQYVIENPLKWDMDSENPDNINAKIAGANK